MRSDIQRSAFDKLTLWLLLCYLQGLLVVVVAAVEEEGEEGAMVLVDLGLGVAGTEETAEV